MHSKLNYDTSGPTCPLNHFEVLYIDTHTHMQFMYDFLLNRKNKCEKFTEQNILHSINIV